jgi:hypothetical protein
MDKKGIHFSQVFEEHDHQANIFKHFKGIIGGIFQGKNVTICTTGYPGAGKSLPSWVPKN